MISRFILLFTRLILTARELVRAGSSPAQSLGKSKSDDPGGEKRRDQGERGEHEERGSVRGSLSRLRDSRRQLSIQRVE
jgi:hypothetical protein